MPRLPLQRLRTLVLNADYHPISITSAYRSVSLCRARQAFALEMDPTTMLVSEKDSLECPSVIVLTEYRKLSPVTHRAAPMKREIMERDQATCQYARTHHTYAPPHAHLARAFSHMHCIV